jgi:predicted Rdx family selenoprotein
MKFEMRWLVRSAWMSQKILQYRYEREITDYSLQKL